MLSTVGTCEGPECNFQHNASKKVVSCQDGGRLGERVRARARRSKAEFLELPLICSSHSGFDGAASSRATRAKYRARRLRSRLIDGPSTPCCQGDLRVKKEFITYETELISKCRKSACPRASYGSEKNSPMWPARPRRIFLEASLSVSKIFFR